MATWAQVRPFRWLTFDIENRPLSYRGKDYTTADITAIAAAWADEDEVLCWVQTKDDRSRGRMLRAFVALYNQADGVTGHYIRGHDLPIINGHLIELGLPTLGPKLTSDTYLDLVKRKELSGSQASLAEMLEIEAPKVGMSDPKWRSANRLTLRGIDATKVRCVGDVIQHKALRARLAELKLLGPPRVWRAS